MIANFGGSQWSGRTSSGKAAARMRANGVGRVFATLPEDLEDHCSAAVLMRARDIVRQAGRMMFDLTCEPESDGEFMTIRGKMRGVTSPSSVYRTWVRFDIRREEYDEGGCTCPAFTGYRYDVCKHMAALVLYFCDEPTAFPGFEGSGAARSSSDLMSYMERLDEIEMRRAGDRRDRMLRAQGLAMQADSGEYRREHTTVFGGSGSGSGGDASDAARLPLAMVGPGQVGLEPIVTYSSRSAQPWSVSFRILNLTNGASYVMKSISGFSVAMSSGAFAQYGQKLAFTHTPDMLDDHARGIMRFIGRALDTRQAALRAARYFSPVVVERDMVISSDELTQLLRLSEGRRIGLLYDEWRNGRPARVPVIGRSRPLRITMSKAREGGTGGYRLRCDVTVDALAEGAARSYMLVERSPMAGADDPAASHSREEALKLSRLGSDGIASLPVEDLARLGVVSLPAVSDRPPTSGPSDGDGSNGPSDDADSWSMDPTDGRWFCRFPKSASELKPVLDSLCGDPDGQFLSDEDLPLFARTLLPVLSASGLDGDVPQNVKDMMPQPCESEFYVDRTETGVSCTLKARYGRHEVGIIPLVPGDRGGSHDFVTERIAEQTVRRYFDVPSARKPAEIDRDDTSQLMRLFDEGLAAMRAVGKVFTTPAFDRLLAPRPAKVRLGAAMHGNLVEVSVLADEVPPDEVGALLASYRRKQRFHRLKDGTIVPLARHDADMDALADAARDLGLDDDAFIAGNGRVEVPGFQAFLLDSEIAAADQAPSFARYVNDLKAVDPNRYVVPDSLAGVLRPYQADGFRWLQALWDKGFGGILADEMGLGKSMQLIALLLARHGDAPLPSLIVCPASLVYNWVAEFAKFAPELDVRTVAGSKADRRDLLKAVKDGAGAPDVLITSYDLLRLDIRDYEGVHCLAMVLDEAQAIKNHTTKVAKAVKSITADHRFALTGTPVENRLAELWSIFDFLMPGLLGSFKRFHERYELPISNEAYGDEGRVQAERLRRLVSVFILRRLKSQVLTDLPDKLENVVTVQLEGEQRKLYAAHEQRLKLRLTKTQAKDFNADRIRILAELTKLRQICCDPRLLYANAKDRSAKLAAIEQLVGNCIDEGKKTLIFSQFTSFLDLIAERLESRGIAYDIITGRTPKKRRVELVDQFNADDVPVFLISLKAGNTGLNLVGASVVIHADPWWNAAAQDQATDRAHRIGQTKDVNVYQIVAKDTIEERMLKLQEAKSGIARQIVGEASRTGAERPDLNVASLTKDDLLSLLSA